MKLSKFKFFFNRKSEKNQTLIVFKKNHNISADIRFTITLTCFFLCLSSKKSSSLHSFSTTFNSHFSNQYFCDFCSLICHFLQSNTPILNMGNDIGRAIATPFTAVGTAIAGQADKKIYYNCPKCGDRVWVYAAAASFVGSKCFNCR